MATGTDGIVVRGIRIPASELQWRFSRSGGPGGQSVNTADSRVELTLDVSASPSLPDTLRRRALERLADRLVDGELTVTASEHRSQLRNRQAAMHRLAAVLTDATAPPTTQRRATRPTRGSRRRRLEGEQRRAQVKRLRRRPPQT
ncbi:MAG: aminoacyl-tRNA hydrolase [Actinomycetota bacterium]|nr:aminoacyl-tRNA hydrolase [Actinomycetota bacterium]